MIGMQRVSFHPHRLTNEDFVSANITHIETEELVLLKIGNLSERVASESKNSTGLHKSHTSIPLSYAISNQKEKNIDPFARSVLL